MLAAIVYIRLSGQKCVFKTCTSGQTGSEYCYCPDECFFLVLKVILFRFIFSDSDFCIDDLKIAVKGGYWSAKL